MGKLAFSVSELSEVLGVNKNYIRELIREEGFPVVKMGKRKIVVPVDALRIWLLEQCGMGDRVPDVFSSGK